MSLSLLIRTHALGKSLLTISKQLQFSNAYSTYGSTALLAQSFTCKSTFGSLNYTTTATTNNKSATPQWTTIYRLPLIRLAAGFQRLKIYQGVLTALALPISFTLTEFGTISPNSVAIVGAIGVSGLVTLTLFSLLIRNVVGFIYINDELNKVKVAYVDFWGKRTDAIIDINDLDVEWAKARPTAFNLYQKIRLYSDDTKSFKLLLNYGVIVEPETFCGIFGE
uniref:Transmembrane protein 186 n=1 Tax=Bactrocera dorsalis TaxID=27457 RepID=A0A034WKV8_BACDO